MADENQPTTQSLEEFVAGISGETGTPLHVKIIFPGDLHVELRAASGHEPATGFAYRARGPDGQVLSGTTDEAGRLKHAGVESGEYELTLEDVSLKVPTVKRGEPPHVRWISKHPRSK